MNDEPRPGLWFIRLHQARLLAPLVARTIRFLPVIATGGFCFLLVFVAHHNHKEGVLPVQLGAIFLSLGVGFVLDDHAESTVAGVPAPQLFRRSLRVALILPPLTAIWALLLWYAGPGGTRWALTLELAGIVGLSVAIAAVASHVVPDGLGGVATGPTILLLFFGQALLPPRFNLLPLSPTSPKWFDVYGRWWLVLAFGALVFVAASLDPARPTLRTRLWHQGSRMDLPRHQAGPRSRRIPDGVGAK